MRSFSSWVDGAAIPGDGAGSRRDRRPTGIPAANNALARICTRRPGGASRTSSRAFRTCRVDPLDARTAAMRRPSAARSASPAAIARWIVRRGSLQFEAIDHRHLLDADAGRLGRLGEHHVEVEPGAARSHQRRSVPRRSRRSPGSFRRPEACRLHIAVGWRSQLADQRR